MQLYSAINNTWDFRQFIRNFMSDIAYHGYPTVRVSTASWSGMALDWLGLAW